MFGMFGMFITDRDVSSASLSTFCWRSRASLQFAESCRPVPFIPSISRCPPFGGLRRHRYHTSLHVFSSIDTDVFWSCFCFCMFLWSACQPADVLPSSASQPSNPSASASLIAPRLRLWIRRHPTDPTLRSFVGIISFKLVDVEDPRDSQLR